MDLNTFDISGKPRSRPNGTALDTRLRNGNERGGSRKTELPELEDRR